ncbi:hypothetical protein OSB04_001129 [Centaurea solstitialis]|uniref:RRM domain-containing protein n=1 Tax=Centaurea solstitialis TaxID=347529 RepID=A0AA38U9M2_9ASTR|nr:hypothetical protein OSB04_001129 [Centaurea solstitialis]
MRDLKDRETDRIAMDSDEGKLFLGGIAWDTTEERLTDYFSKYGDVSQTVIMRDKITGRPRGFGFVVFSDPSLLDSVLNDRHTIDGRNLSSFTPIVAGEGHWGKWPIDQQGYGTLTPPSPLQVEAKRALSREEQQASRPGGNAGRSSGGAGNYRTKKIFVGGLPSTLTEEQFRQYFETYGDVTDVVIMFDQNTNRPRGFGFVSFDTEDAVDRVLQKTFHELNNKLVEVKRALPKDANPGGGGGGGGGGRGGGYQGNNAGSFNSQIRAAAKLRWRVPAYSGYGQPSYGFGAPNGNAGYGGYGGYGVGGYGGASAGYGGPGGAYGNPSAANSGYVGGSPSALKTQWSGQTPGYGGAGYGGNAGYGANVLWNAAGGGGGGVPAPVGQSPSGASGYGNQGYGYGGYGANDGYNTNTGGYGAGGGGGRSVAGSGISGGDQQGGGGGGYMGGPYNGQAGYSNAGWRSES